MSATSHERQVRSRVRKRSRRRFGSDIWCKPPPKLVSCPCDPFPASYTGCSPQRGCLTGLTCSAACDAGVGAVVMCIDYVPCLNGPGFQASKQCSNGNIGDLCDVEADCVAPHNCVNGPGFQDGNICTLGQSGDPCETNADCINTTCNGSNCI